MKRSFARSLSAGNSARTSQVAVVLKTNEGGIWVLPQIRAFQELGYSCALLVPKGRGKLSELARDEGIELVELEFDFSFSNPVRVLRGLSEIRTVLKRRKVSVVVYHLYASALAARFATVGSGIKRVHVVPGPLFLEYWPVRAVERCLVALDHLLVSGSEYTYKEYGRLKGLKPRRHVMIPYGVDTNSRDVATVSSRTQARIDLGIPREAFVGVLVGYVYSPKLRLGHSQGIKGHETLLSAWAKFSAVHDDAHLLLVGSGFDDLGEEYRSSLMRQCQLGSVSWIDSVQDVASYYHAADVSVSPSLSENHGAAMEANAYGVPSVVSNVGGLPEMVTESSGWLVPPEDPTAVFDALVMAYEERQLGFLAARAEDARTHCSRLYSNSKTSRKLAIEVANLAENIKPVSIFTEARLQRDPYGQWHSSDTVNGDETWREYGEKIGRVQLAAREDPGGIHDLSCEISSVEVYGIRSYRGLFEAMIASPRVATDILRITFQSRGVIARLPGPIGTIAVIAGRLCRKPVAVEILGDPQDVALSGALGRTGVLASSFLGSLTRIAIRQSDVVHYVTERVLQEKYPARRSAISLAFSDVLIPEPRSPMLPRTGSADTDVLRILIVGSQSNNYKRHNVAIKAVRVLIQRGIRARLTVVGDGAYQPVLRELATRVGLDDSEITFLGAVSREAVLEAMRNHDVFLHLSATEGLPRVVIEAMSTGMPVVGTAVGGLAELVHPDFCVPVDDPVSVADKVTELVDGEYYRLLSQYSLDTAIRFTPSALGPVKREWFETLNKLFRSSE